MGETDLDIDIALTVLVGSTALEELVCANKYLASLVRDEGLVSVYSWLVDG